MLAQLKEHGNDPLTPVVVQRGLKQDQINYLVRAPLRVPRRPDAGQLPAQLPVPVARRAGARLRRPDLARGVQAAEAARATSRPTRSARPASSRPTTRYLRGKDGKAQLTVDSRGRPKGAARLEAEPTPGQALRLTIDIKLQRAAERALRYGVDLARRSGIEGLHADGGAIVALEPAATARCSRWRRTRPTSRRSTSAARTRRSSRRCSNAKVAAEQTNHPGLNRAIDVALSARLDLQAGDGARGDAGGPDEAVRRRSRARPTSRRTGRSFKNWTPLIDQWIDAADRARRVVRHLLLRARPATSTTCRRAAATRCRPGRTRFGFGEPTRHRRRARGARPRADARVAAQARSRGQRLQRDRPHLEAGLLDPDGDRPGRPRS